MRAIDINILEPLPLYILEGDDDYLLSLARRNVRELAGGLMSDFNINDFSLNATNYREKLSEIESALSVYSFGASVKVADVEITITKDNKDFVKSIKDFIVNRVANVKENDSVLLLRYRAESIAELRKYGTLIDCSRLQTGELLPLVASKINDDGKTINTRALEKLILRSDRLISNIYKELEKLYAYIENDLIDEDAVNECLPEKGEYIIFEITNALALGDKTRAYKALDSIVNSYSNRSSGAMAILNLLIGHYRRMFFGKISKLSDADLAATLGCKPYAITAARQAAAKYKPMQLKTVVDKLHSIESDYKQGRLETSEIVPLTVCEIFRF